MPASRPRVPSEYIQQCADFLRHVASVAELPGEPSLLEYASKLDALPLALQIEAVLAEVEASRSGKDDWHDATPSLAIATLNALSHEYGTMPFNTLAWQQQSSVLPPSPRTVQSMEGGMTLWADAHRLLQTQARLEGVLAHLEKVGLAAGWLKHSGASTLQNAWHVASALAVMNGLPKLPDQSANKVQGEPHESVDVISVTRWVLTDQMDAVKSRLRTLQDKALKMNLPPPEMTVTGRQKMVDLPIVLQDGSTDPSRVVSVLKSEVVFSGAVPRVNGYRFLAKIEHERMQEGGFQNLVFAPSLDANERLSKSAVGNNAHGCPPNCDHCEQKRARKTTFLIDGPEGMKQVGSSCVDDFIGHGTLSKIMASFDLQMFLLRDDEWNGMDRDYMRSCREPTWWSMVQYLALANALTKTSGFVKSDAPMSTRDLCVEAILRPSRTSPELRRILQMTDDEIRQSIPEVVAMLDFYRDLDSTSTYVQNMKVLLTRDHLNLTHRFSTGLLASAPSSYYRATQQGVHLNEPFGVEKERGPLKLRVYNIKEYTNSEHPSVKYFMSDDLGRKFSWSTAYPGNRLMSIGGTVVLNATIKGHSIYEGTHTTQITRCDQIEQVDPGFPVPDFYAGASKRVIKESFKFTLMHTDEHGKIDGESYLHVQRSWKEAGKIRRYEDALPVPLHEGWEVVLLSAMERAGVSRRDDKGAFVWDPKVDKAFKSATTEAASPYLLSAMAYPPEMYCVDDAFAPLLSPVPQQWGDPHASAEELFKKQPKLFSLRSDAEQHGHQISIGRLQVIQSEQWRPMVVPSTFRLSSLDEQQQFIERAIKKGYNMLLTASDAGVITKMEPLGFHPAKLGHGLNVVATEAVHRPMVDAQEKRSSRHLAGRKFLAISGVTSSPELVTKIRPVLSAACTSMQPSVTVPPLKMDWMAPREPTQGGCPHLASLRYLCGDEIEGWALKERMVVFVDESTQYYLRTLGADVVNVGIGPSQVQDASILDAPRVAIESDAPEAIETAVASLLQQVKSVIENPSRDQQRARQMTWRAGAPA
jgi:hypothetical protein